MDNNSLEAWMMGRIAVNVSIIIPVYKVEKLLPRCLDSLLQQTHTEWKAYLIDDCSPDASGEIASAYAQKDSRFCYMRNERNLGVSATRNRGLDQVKDGYVAFVDSDDWWEPDALEKMLSAAEKYKADLVQCAWRINYPDGKEIPEKNTFAELRVFSKGQLHLPLRKMLTGISMNHVHRKLVRSDLIRQIRFVESLKTAEDLEFCFQLLKRAEKVVFVPDALYHYYRDGSGLTGSALSFKKKWKANRVVSDIMLRDMRGTELDTAYHRLLAHLRPCILVIDKALRLVRDWISLKK